jgi:cytochrome c553
VLKPGIPGSPGNLIPSDINPNGASELATLMRTFVADWKDTKAKLEAAQPVTAKLPVHRRIRCSWPTAKEDRDAKFDALAVAYLEHVKAFDAAPSRERFDGVISACAACHEATCGGPLDLINSLRFPAK